MTTPQPAAQQVAVRAAQMARKTNMRLLGAVENMSSLVGSGEEIFGSGGGEALAAELDVPLLGKIPLDPRLRESADRGEPLVWAEPDAEASVEILRARGGDRRHASRGGARNRQAAPRRRRLELARCGPRTSSRGFGALGFDERRSAVLAEHFLEAERRGKRGHGFSRVEWLATQDVDPDAEPARLVVDEGYERWDGNGAVGYLTLAAVCDAQIASPPERARVVVASHCFPTGMLGHYTRRLAEAGLVAALTATSPARLGHPEGGPPLAGTNPLSIAIPSSDGEPIVADVSMGAVTYGDVIAGLAEPDELVPFGGEQAHKAFALALGLQLLVDCARGGGSRRRHARRPARGRPGPGAAPPRRRRPAPRRYEGLTKAFRSS